MGRHHLSACQVSTHEKCYPCLLLETRTDTHVWDPALVMMGTPYPLTVLSAMLCRVLQSLTLCQDTGDTNKRITNMDMETAEGAPKEVCSGMSRWRRVQRGQSLSLWPEDLESIKWKQVTKLKWAKGDNFPQYVIDLQGPTMGNAECIFCFNKKIQNGNLWKKIIWGVQTKKTSTSAQISLLT